MISISGIKHQGELEKLPVFNKNQASVLIGKESRNLDKKLAQLQRIGYLLPLKNGLYTTSGFYETHDKSQFKEYLANIIRSPSYLSQEYVLSKNGLIPESVFSLTSITTKSSRVFETPQGTYIFQNMKPALFTGFAAKEWQGMTIFEATPAKALFDFLYLKKMIYLKREVIFDLRINWENFKSPDFDEFEKYADLSGSKKMSKIFFYMKSL